jgi:porin
MSVQNTLGQYGDPGGLRSFLRSKGVDYSLTYIAETLGNPTGGIRRGSTYGGRLDFQFDADLGKMVGWHGATFHANLYQIHGLGLSGGFVGNLMTVSSIEALPSSRLYELWLEQKAFDGQVAIKVGQIAADTEFAVSQTSTLFVNSTFGWPNIMGVVLPSGGPAYPLATPAVRVKYVPNPNLSLQAGVFDGDPAGRSPSGVDPQRRNRAGMNFRVEDRAFVIAEAAYAYNTAAGDGGEPGTVTLGGWYHLARFDSPRFDGSGLSLANPSSTGFARRFRGNHGVYGIIDQTIYREPNDSNDGASVFVRVSASPGDRNLIDAYFDAGIAYKGLLSGRSDDTLGIAFALARFSPSARGLNTDMALYTDALDSHRTSERVIEATYQAVVGPGFTVQPTIQYVFRPGGGVANTRAANETRVRDAAVLGLRATVRY